MIEPLKAAPYGQVLFDMEEAHKNGLRAFAVWLQTHWPIGGLSKEAADCKSDWERTYESDFPGMDYIEGWNAAIASLDGALDCYMQE